MTEAPQLLSRFSDDLADAVARASASIVRVDARRRSNPASGITWAPGVVLTADHVLEREEDITVGLPDGREVAAQIVGRDPSTDLALLRLAAEGGAVAARGPDPRVGHFVLVVARPGTLAATAGVVSAIGGPARTFRGGRLDAFIRTDAAMYPGFSGGALVNSAGQVVGLMTTHFGGALALPLAVIDRVVGQLQAGGRVRRGYLGITSQPIALPPALRARAPGEPETALLVVGVEPGGPAERGGMLVGDLLVGFAGQPVRDTDDLQVLLSADRIGQPTELLVLRGGEPKHLTVVVGERSS
ncbi:MAG: S1C family serine protease [Chloroflexi bacterium]|nr:S1C family serine protease [Chloroflexota bacterium]